MAKYYYKKYRSVREYRANESSYEKMAFTSRYAAKEYTITSTGKLELVDREDYGGMGKNPPVGYYGYDGVSGSTDLIKYSSFRKTPSSTGIPCYGYAVSVSTVYSRGSLISSNIVAENGTYPNNGRHSDGYWYVRGGLANIAPTIPSSITVPELKSGKSSTISWGASTDEDGDTINYYLERSINSGAYTVIRNGGTTINHLDTPDKSWNTVQYRVRAYDGKAYSGYRTSSAITVKHFPEMKLRVDGTLKTSDDGWVRVNGVFRKIDGIWIRTNGILKEV